MNQEASATQITPIERFDVPEELVAADSKLVYLFVTVAGGATIDELHSTLDIKKISLYPVLETLSDRGLVDCVDGEYVVPP
jgi:predicted transcriptional regulator